MPATIVAGPETDDQEPSRRSEICGELCVDVCVDCRFF